MPVLYELEFLYALGLTLLIEVPILVFLFPVVERRKADWPSLVFAGMFASALTLPYIWFVLPAFVPPSAYVAMAEAFAVLVESGIYCVLLRLAPARAFALSLACNVASFVLGGWLLARF